VQAAEAAARSAYAVCALTTSDAEVVSQLLAFGALELLTSMLRAAGMLLGEGVSALLSTRPHHSSGPPTNLDTLSHVPGPRAFALVGVPPIWSPRNLLAAATAIRNLAIREEVREDIARHPRLLVRRGGG